MDNFKSFFILILTVIVLNDNRLIERTESMVTSFFAPINSSKSSIEAVVIPTINTQKKRKSLAIKNSVPKKFFEKPVKLDLKKYFKQVAALDLEVTESNPTDLGKEIETTARKFLGYKYVWGGTTPKGFDCSGFTKYVFERLGYNLPRTALQQSRIGTEVLPSEFKKGDLLYFNTDKSRGLPVSHVGIYLANGKFIHAANSKKGVIVSSFDSYKNTFVKATRVFQDIPVLVSAPKSIVNPTLKTSNKMNSFMAQYDPFVIYEGRYIRQSQLSQLQRKNND